MAIIYQQFKCPDLYGPTKYLELIDFMDPIYIVIFYNFRIASRIS